MEKITLNLTKGRIKVMKSLLKYEYEDTKNLQEFILDLVDVGLDTMLGNLNEDRAIEVIRDLAEQD